jgi:D-serine deaminase-like pyridoxal phosphate-dependent protein
MRPHRPRRKSQIPLVATNSTLIGKAHSRARLSTPALVLDLDAFEHNLNTMSNYCRVHGTTLRPHAKSHKSARIAALQAKRGAVGICVATMREAQVMIAAGIRGVLITSPMVGEAKLDALTALLQRDPSVMVVVDSVVGVKAMESRLQRSRLTAKVLIDVDVGMTRTGVASLHDALRLARRVDASDRLELLGLQCYSGMVQHIDTYAKRLKNYGRELALLESIIDGFKREGLPTKIVTGGGTGTFDIDRERGLFTECQAGSYIFMDVQYNAVELLRKAPNLFRTSLFVQSMVLSNNYPGAATLDAGFKSFAMDGPLPLVQFGAPGDAIFQFYGDEFGKLTWARKSKRLPLAKKVEFVTPHCDPTVNLHNVYHCVRGNRLVDIWPVDARGPV